VHGATTGNRGFLVAGWDYDRESRVYIGIPESGVGLRQGIKVYM
jgi:hypothetical protein